MKNRILQLGRYLLSHTQPSTLDARPSTFLEPALSAHKPRLRFAAPAVGVTLVLLALGVSSTHAVNISVGNTLSESFTIGTSATATLPTDWKADKQTTARLVGAYASAVSATEQRAGNNMSTSAANGIYNYAAGDPTTSTERAVGFISSSSATKTGNLYLKLDNNGANAITSLTISYTVEKYRKGSNTAGYQYQLYYSTDGSTWTSAGSDFLTEWTAGDADNTGYTPAPGDTKSVSSKTLTVTVNASGTLYLCWSYSVRSGSTTSNAQGLGIDDVGITANGAAAPTVTIDNTGAPAAGNITAGTSDVALFGFRLTPSGGSVDFTGLSLSTAGTSTSSDLSNFRVVYDADNSGTYNGGDSIVSASAQALANPIAFAISGQTGFSAARRYLVIADVATGATAGHTFTGSITAAGDVTTTGAESETAAGNQQTVVAAANSAQSDITRASGFSEPVNIDYASYQATDVTAGNSIELARFTIRDGGGSADSDSASTTLTAISLSVANGGILRRVALYDGTTEVAEVAGGTTVGFSGLSGLVAADGSTKDFSVRATFNASVTDNAQLQFTVSSATADSGGSMFPTANAGGAASDATGDANRIEVTATKLVLSSVPSSVTVSQNFTTTVEAQDPNNNLDVDSSTAVTVSKVTGGGTLSSATGLTQSLASGTQTWSDVQIDTAGSFTIQAAGGSLTTATSGSIAASVLFLEEDFDHTAEDNITSHGWVAHSAGGTNPIKVKSPGLSYAGYASSGIGLAASMTTSGEDDHKNFASAASAGSVYAAFLVNASASQTTGDYFFHLYETSSLFDGRVFIKKDASSSNFAFGLSKANEAATYTGFAYGLNTTYLVVVKYTFNGSSQDDTVALFVNPTPGGSEPTATVGPLTATINDAVSLVAVALRQGASGSMPTVVVDGIRVGATWADVVACTPPATSAITGDSSVAIGQMGKIYSVTPTSGSSYAWTVPSGASISAGATGPNNNQITVAFGSTSGNVTVTETTSGGCVGTPVSLAVTVSGNHAPVAPAAKTLGTVKNTATTNAYVKLLVGATDADSDTLTVTAASTPTLHGTTELVAEGVKYTPATDYTGPDSFTYTISDGNGGTAVGTVNVTVEAGTGLSPNVVVPPSYANGKFSVTFAGIPGFTYTVEYAEGSAAPPWAKLVNVTAGGDGLFVVEDTVSQSPSRYYRTVWPSY